MKAVDSIPTFLELKKNCSKSTDGKKPHKLVVLGDCATQHLAMAIQGYGFAVGFDLKVLDVDYDQIAAQVLDEDSELFRYEPETVVIHMCVEKLYTQYCNLPLEQRGQFAEQAYRRIAVIWGSIKKRLAASIVQILFLEDSDAVFGSFGLQVTASFDYQVRMLNHLIMTEGSKEGGIFFVDLNRIQMQLGRDNFKSDKMFFLAKMPLSTIAIPWVAKAVLDIILAISGKIKKCVVLDLDNTLWGGIIGDDGIEGIQIGELGSGPAYTAFQYWLRELKNRGIILAVCSKNNIETAKEPFIYHPDMVLRLDDISIFVANWNDKATNIRYIQKTLNIGMDSLVFLDDNPFERNLVRQMIPEITVPELPEDPADFVSFLKYQNLFETASYSVEDQFRTKQYQANVNRIESESMYDSYEEYLIGLKMIATASPFDEYHYPRIAQLTQRSNQFNLRTIRYNEDQIREIATDGAHITLYFTLRDRFGDHGLISVVILDKKSSDTLFISEWLMSCRVLKRGMEEFIVNKIIEVASQHGYQTVLGEYLPTPKNAMVETIYENLGFKNLGGGIFSAKVIEFNNNPTWIKEE